MNAESCVFIVCTEPGFEWKSRLLLRSLRAFGGRLADCPVLSYSPRPSMKPSADCLAEFQKLRIDAQCDDINIEFFSYGLANKIVAMADAERRLPYARLVFLDSDKVILDEPMVLGNADELQFMARPVDVKGIGTSHFGALPNGAYWKDLYDVCGVRKSLWVTTSVDHRKIVAYFNSGMFMASSAAGLLSAWLENFRRVWNSKLRPAKGEFFVEQSVLAATVAARCDRVGLLPRNYNVPVHLIMPQRAAEMFPRKAVSIHYHHILDDGLLTEKLSGFAGVMPTGRVEWIISNIRSIVSSRAEPP